MDHATSFPQADSHCRLADASSPFLRSHQASPRHSPPAPQLRPAYRIPSTETRGNFSPHEEKNPSKRLVKVFQQRAESEPKLFKRGLRAKEAEEPLLLFRGHSVRTTREDREANVANELRPGEKLALDGKSEPRSPPTTAMKTPGDPGEYICSPF